ncbi:MAG TPA: hypothetical protein VHA55_01865 [Pseudorhodoplanes sp.]|jgi:hypothetical protein|nr:hypothetical protein [Pseudorhodoplanes sp.]
MTYRLMSAVTLAAVLGGAGSAAAQTVYVERYGPPPAYVAPADSYVIEEREIVLSYPPVTYERRVVRPGIERRVIEAVDGTGATYVTETDEPVAPCGYDAFGRLICD